MSDPLWTEGRGCLTRCGRRGGEVRPAADGGEGRSDPLWTEGRGGQTRCGRRRGEVRPAVDGGEGRSDSLWTEGEERSDPLCDSVNHVQL